MHSYFDIGFRSAWIFVFKLPRQPHTICVVNRDELRAKPKVIIEVTQS